MQNKFKSCRDLALTKVFGLIFGVLIAGVSSQAVADDHREITGAASGGTHQSFIRVRSVGENVSRNITIGLGKSVLVEFPVEVRDVMLSNPAALDAVVLSSNRVFLLARTMGESNAFFFDPDGGRMATLEIFIQRETAGLQDMLKRLIPGSDIKVEMMNATVILTGTVRTPSDSVRATKIAENFASVGIEAKFVNQNEGVQASAARGASGEKTDRVLNMLSVEAGEQVMLRVMVAEVQRTILKQFGVNLGATINAGNFATTLLTANALPLTSAAGLGALPVPAIATTGDTAGQLSLFNDGPSNPALAPFGNSGTAGVWGTGQQAIAHTLRALERQGLVRTLAEPNLTAVSGESAKFLAGGEFPIPRVSSDGDIAVTFKEFGVGLSFTPFVLSEGRISLKIDTEVSELSSAGSVTLNFVQIPALQTRRATSTVELPSGGSLAIAGLLSEDTRQNIDGFPGLKDVPILGTLFRSRDFVREETELVVIVTPYIVRPTSPKQFAAPTKGLVASTDAKANFMGHVNRIYGGNDTTIPEGGLKGDYGFIVE